MRRQWLDLLEKGLLIVLSGFILWPNAISSIALISLLCIQLLRMRLRVLPSFHWLWLMIPPLLILVSWILHGAASDGIRELQLWATWIAAIVYFRNSKVTPVFCYAFVSLSALQALFILTWITFSEALPSMGFGQHLRDTIQDTFHVHPTYLSAIYFWAAILSFQLIRIPKSIRYVLVILLVIIGTLSGGKMPLIAFTLVSAIVVLMNIKGIYPKLIATVGVLSVLLLLVRFNPVLNERFQELSRINLDYEKGQMLSSTELRLGIWKCSFEAVSDHWLLGVGTGNTRKTLETCYSSYDQIEFFETEYNEHNQFLHFWLACGIIGLIGIIAFFFLLFKHSLTLDHPMLLLFSIYICLIFITENYLTRQHGMMLWALFTAAFLFPKSEHSSFLKPFRST